MAFGIATRVIKNLKAILIRVVWLSHLQTVVSESVSVKNLTTIKDIVNFFWLSISIINVGVKVSVIITL